jgi:hypothetical protein
MEAQIQTVQQEPLVATWANKFRNEMDEIVVEVHDSLETFAWRMGVNGDWSRWYRMYDGVLVHKEYCLVTSFFTDLKEFHPFKITYASKQEERT